MEAPVCWPHAANEHTANDLCSLFSGIGKMMTMALAENGAYKVYIIGRREAPSEEMEQKYPG